MCFPSRREAEEGGLEPPKARARRFSRPLPYQLDYSSRRQLIKLKQDARIVKGQPENWDLKMLSFDLLIVLIIGLPLVAAYAGFLLEVAALAMALTRLRTAIARPHSSQSTFPVTEPVTIVMAARNEATALPACIQAIRAQKSVRPIHLILVNDGSTDETQVIAEKAFLDWPTARLVSSDGKGKMAALAQASKLVKTKILLFTDADTIPDENWVEAHVEALQKADVSFGHVRVLSNNPLRPLESALSTVRTLSNGNKTDLPLRPPFVRGANWAIRHKAFIDAGGFEGLQSKSSGDDVHLVKRLNRMKATFAFAPNAHLTTTENLDATDLSQQSRRRYAKWPALPWIERFRQFRLGTAIIAWLLSPFTIFFMRAVDVSFWFCFWIGSILVPLFVAHRFIRRTLPLLNEPLPPVGFWKLLQLGAQAFYFTLLGHIAGYSWKPASPQAGKQIDE
jgi:cellulose synthase/poly-beta-1,6-N-acetylglucosamine synthase-like glycosyltransferase